MPEFGEPSLLAQLQDLNEQPRKRLQVALAEGRDGAEIRRIKRDNAHKINTLAARQGDAARTRQVVAFRARPGTAPAAGSELWEQAWGDSAGSVWKGSKLRTLYADDSQT